MTNNFQIKQGVSAFMNCRWLGLALLPAVFALGVWVTGRGASTA